MNLKHALLLALFIAHLYSSSALERQLLQKTNSAASSPTSKTKTAVDKKKKSEYPFVCKIVYAAKSSFLCGGILVDSNYVATAAHCVDSLRPSKKKEKLKVHCDDSSYVANVVNIILHEEWLKIPRLPNDIALLSLDKPSKLPIANYTAVNTSLVDAELISFEWKKKNGDYDVSSKGDEVVLVDKKILGADGAALFRLPYKGTNTTHPLYFAAISSFGTKRCDRHGFPVIYTPIAKYSTWIHTEIFGPGAMPESTGPAPLTGEQFLRNITDLYKGKNASEIIEGAKIAIANDDVQTLEVILTLKINPETTYGPDERTLLHFAAEQNSYNTARLLIKEGANSSEVSASGASPLHIAATNGSIAVADLLLKTGAYVNAVDEEYETPLHYLLKAEKGKLTMLLYLLEAGANVHEEDALDVTPLHRVAESNWESAAKVLLKAGANLIEYAFDNGAPIHWAAAFGSNDVLKVLIDAGTYLESRPFTRLSETPLSYAVRNGGPLSSIKILLDNDANPDVKDSDGYTPLHRAAHRGVPDIIIALIKAGASKSTTNKDRKYPVDLFCKKRDCHSPKYRRAFKLLDVK